MEEFDKSTRVGRKKATTLAIGAYKDTGKLPPQALELEEAVLGALMLEKEAMNIVLQILTPDAFYKESHQRIYRAIVELFNKSEPIDILTVVQQLKLTGELELVGGSYFVTQLTSRLASAANIEYHARIVQEKHIQRELIRISDNTIRKSYEDTTDVFDLLDETEKNLFEITNGLLSKKHKSIGDLVMESIKEMETAKDHQTGLTGVPSGFTNLDRLTSGWQKSDLVIVAARPSMGKTSFVLSMARNMALEHKKGVAFFSLEMSSIQLVNRLISIESEIPADRIRNGKLDGYQWEQLLSKVTKLKEAPVYIDDTPQLSIFELRAKARRLKAQFDIKIIMIDYLQLMTGGGGGDNKSSTREQEISHISRSLKALAKELEIPVIALSQLSREVEKRGNNKKPQLSDLRESGAIEQDADLVLFLYRPEYYQIFTDDEGNDTRGIAEIIVAKHRNGATDTVRTRFVHEFARFTDEGIASYNPNYQYNDNEGLGGAGSVTFSSKINDMNDEDDIDF